MNSRIKKRILFLCTHNSARSQMAEGLVRHLYPDSYDAYSAGVMPIHVNRFALHVMQEIGIDISHHHAKSIQEFKDQRFDYVVTVCDHAREKCPFFPRAEHYLHASMPDPSRIVASSSDRLEEFRVVRDSIRSWVQETFGPEASRDR